MMNTPNSSARGRLIFALDAAGSMEEAMIWIDRLKDHVGMFKVGKESFTAFGPDIVTRIKDCGAAIFLDLKYHDIPQTVSRAAVAAAHLGVSMLNIHALGGKSMMEETIAALREDAARTGADTPLVLAVTVLTSLHDEDLQMLGFNMPAAALTVRLAQLAREAGLAGVVSSPQDIPAIRRACGDDFVIVTPGIRSARDDVPDDQKRVLTAEEAAYRGADYIVVGRPIRSAPDPEAAADGIVAAMSRGLAARERNGGHSFHGSA
jgi:orotidine-5'-phosphate decarboxylase